MNNDIKIILESKLRDELNIIARKLRIPKYRSLAKNDLISTILAFDESLVRQSLSITWWDRYHNHVYGGITTAAFILSIVFGTRACNTDTRLNKLHIQPQVDCYLVRSVDKESLEFYLKNRSPIPVVNLSVEHKYFVFLETAQKYVAEYPAMTSILDSPGQNWVFKQELGPNDSFGKKEYQILSQFDFYEGKSRFFVAAIFKISFYRETDMRYFGKKAIFFLDSEKIYSYKNALDQDHLKEPIKQLSAFESKMLSIREKTEMPTGGSRLYQKGD